MQEFLLGISAHHMYLVYVLIIVLACAEGPMLSVLCGILIKAGYFKFWPIYLVLMVGDLLGDILWYEIGRHYGHGFIRRFGKYFNLKEEGVAKATAIFHKHKNPILLISKITNGFGLALVTLISAGIARIPFKQYLAINVLGQLVWTGILIAGGYFFGTFYMQMEAFMGRVSAIILVAVAAFLAFFLYKWVRDTIIRRAKLN